MPTGNDPFLLSVLQACAESAPQPLYPARFAKEANLDRDQLEHALDELRKRGLLKFTDWVKGSGQGYALTEAGQQAHQAKRLLWSAPTESADKPKASGVSTYERGEMVRAVLLEPATPYVSRILLAMNLLYFGYGAFLATRESLVIGDYLGGRGQTINEVLIDLGALWAPLVLADELHPGVRPQYERLVLFLFLHVGLLHLFMNMYFLTTLGPFIESMWGSVRFLAIYFVAGIVSGCFVVLMELWRGQFALTAGASGALFGIFASLVVWYLFNRQHLPERVVQGMSRNLGINLCLLTAINFFPGVSWQGHLGGAVGGVLAALLLHVQRYHPSAIVRMLALLAVPLVPIGFFAAMLWEAKGM
jgi:rhomboid protease GluP